MKMEQVYDLVNPAVEAVLGETVVLQQDLSNVVSVGETLEELANTTNGDIYDHYVKSLVNHIGRVKFVNRVYKGSVPSILMESWEYGSILQKVKVDMPVAEENPTWELVDGETYDPNKFYSPKASSKFFNDRVTYQIPISYTREQVKESFSNAAQLGGFIATISTQVDNAMTVRLNSLIRATINSMTANTLLDEFKGAPKSTDTGTKAINLLKLYKDAGLGAADMTPEQCLTDPEFIRFASYNMKMYIDRIAEITTVYNMGGMARFTPNSDLHLVTLSQFDAAADVYLQSDTYHKELTALPKKEKIGFWQGIGEKDSDVFGFQNASSIKVKTKNGEVETSGILAVMFDHEALGVTNVDHNVNTHFNPLADFYNNFYKYRAGYFNDGDENFIVFFVA